MKQMLLLAFVSFLGIAGSFAISPVWGIAVYYMFAVLRPQFIWEWVEAMGIELKDVPWSFSVAVATLVSTAMWRVGILFPLGALKEPWYGRPRFVVSHYLMLGFAIWVTLSYLNAIKPEEAERYFIEYVKIFAMFFCATQVVRTIENIWLIYYLVLGSAIYAAYEINMYYFVDNFQLLNQRGYGGLDNNGGALIVAMAVPMSYFAWEACKRWYRWGFLIAIPPLTHALMLSFSRGGMASLGVAAIWVWVRARNKWFLSAAYLLMVGFVLAGSGKELHERFFSMFSSAEERDESATSRLTTWAIAIKMANEKPFFGFGVRNSNLFTRDYGADMEGRSIHSQYLQTAADCGWVGAGLYVAMLASTFLGIWWVRWYLRKHRDPETQKVRSLGAGLECALFLFCIGAAFLSLEHFEMPYILLLLAMQLHAITVQVAAKRGAIVTATGPGAPIATTAVRPAPTAATATP